MQRHHVPEDQRAENVHEEGRQEHVEVCRIDDVDDEGTSDRIDRSTGRYREPPSAGDRRREAQSVSNGEP